MNEQGAFASKREEIRHRRRVADLTQSALAKRAKLSQTKLSLYESDLIDLNSEELGRLEKALVAIEAKENSKTCRLSDLRDPRYLSEMIGKKSERPRKYARVDAELSQRELVKMMGISQSRLSQWENGKIEWSPEENEEWIRAIQQALELKFRKDLSHPEVKLEQERSFARELFKRNKELKKLVDQQKSLIELLLQERENAQKKLSDKDETIQKLASLCDIRTKEALAHSEAEELAAKIEENEE